MSFNFLHSFSSHHFSLYHTYAKYLVKRISCGNRVDDDVIHSAIDDLTLKEFVVARTIYCYKAHKHQISSCNICKPYVGMAEEIIEKGVVPFAASYRQHHHIPYKADKATRFFNAITSNNIQT